MYTYIYCDTRNCILLSLATAFEKNGRNPRLENKCRIKVEIVVLFVDLKFELGKKSLCKKGCPKICVS